MNQKGQALVSVLMIITITILAASTAVVAASLSLTAGRGSQSNKVYYAAETGVEEALIKLLRDPSYGSGNLTLNGAAVQISVQTPILNPNQRIITSEATLDNIRRRVEVSASFTNNVLTVNSWKETP